MDESFPGFKYLVTPQYTLWSYDMDLKTWDQFDTELESPQPSKVERRQRPLTRVLTSSSTVESTTGPRSSPQGTCIAEHNSLRGWL